MLSNELILNDPLRIKELSITPPIELKKIQINVQVIDLANHKLKFIFNYIFYIFCS